MLDARDIDAIAEAVAERVAPVPHEGLVRVEDVCRLLSVERSWVYDHQVELGARKLDGALRFDIATVRGYAASCAVTDDQPVDDVERRRRNGARHQPEAKRAAFELLPIPERAW